MSYLVAAIEHHARKLANAVTRAVVEKCSGYSAYEAGDFLTGEQASVATEDARAMRAERAEGWRQVFVDAEAEQEVAEPWQCPAHLKGCPCVLAYGGHVGGWHCCEHGARFARPKTPAAGQRGENPAGVTPPTPAGSPDPSRVTVGAVRGEGSPADSDIPSSPAGERPAWVDWAVPAICDVLAVHTALVPIGDALVHCGGLDGECHSHYGDWELWREHVAGLIAERIEAASKARFCIDGGEPQSVALNAFEFERYLDGWLNPGREHVAHRNTQK